MKQKLVLFMAVFCLVGIGYAQVTRGLQSTRTEQASKESKALNNEMQQANTVTRASEDVVCNAITSFTESFEDAYPSDCWSTYESGYVLSYEYAATGSRSIKSAMVYSSPYPTRGLITPQIAVQNSYIFSFKLRANSAYYADYKYTTVRVKVSTTDNQPSSFTTIKEFSTYDYEGINPNNVIVGYYDVVYDWYEAQTDLSAYAGQDIYIALETYDHAGFNFYIDDVSVFKPAENDAAITDITAPVSGQDLSAAETVTATIKNNGANPITSVGLELKVNGAVVANETYNGNIASGATENYTFAQTIDLSAAGDYTISVRAILEGDENAENDLQTVTVHNTVCTAVFPGIESFEAGLFPPLCWSRYAYIYDADAYSLYTNAISATGAYCLTINGVSYASRTYALVTPRIAVQNAYIFTFKLRANGWQGSYNNYTTVRVKVSTTDIQKSSFTTIKEFSTYDYDGINPNNVILEYSDIQGIWYEAKTDLSAYAGQNIYISLETYDNHGNSTTNIDDVGIIQDIQSINDAALLGNNIKLYPNPANNNIVIENAAGSHVKIYDISGKAAFDSNINNAVQTVDISNIAAGVYFVELQNQTSKSTVKLIKK